MPYLTSKNMLPDHKKRDKAMSKDNRQLVYVGGKIKFRSETDLEDYIEENFNEIFPELELLNRQHSIKMQRCDLLCYDKSTKQPVIIELKNEEDRYIVSQLIRYRYAILTNKPFADKINYSLSVKLIAITPSFHEDNYTDKEASKFENDLYFWEFSLDNDHNLGKFKLCGNSYNIPYPIFGLPDSSFSLELNSVLTGFSGNFANKLSQEDKQDFIALRSLLLAQPKVKEMISGSYRKILYGTGESQNHKKIAEITNTSKGLCLYLWLPTRVKTNIKIPVTRFAFICEHNKRPLSKNSTVQWLICTKDTIDIKAEYSFSKDFSFNRHGMLKLCYPRVYLSSVTLGSSNTFWLLMYLLKGITPPMDDETSNWWEANKEKTPTNLGWFIDLALKTWNYRLK